MKNLQEILYFNYRKKKEKMKKTNNNSRKKTLYIEEMWSSRKKMNFSSPNSFFFFLFTKKFWRRLIWKDRKFFCFFRVAKSLLNKLKIVAAAFYEVMLLRTFTMIQEKNFYREGYWRSKMNTDTLYKCIFFAFLMTNWMR